MARRLSQKDMSTAKHEMEVYNSRKKRGLVRAPEKINSVWHVVCGCGTPGCIFIAPRRNETIEEQKESVANFEAEMANKS